MYNNNKRKQKQNSNVDSNSNSNIDSSIDININSNSNISNISDSDISIPGVIVREGKYHNTELIVRDNTSVDVKTLEQLLLQEEAKQSIAAVFVTLPEASFHMFLEMLLRNNYKFHRHMEAHHSSGSSTRGASGSFSYYKWKNPNVHDKVPAFATSIEGGGAMILSPDEKRVLMIMENHRNIWKFVTGAVDVSESGLETVRREAIEDVGVQLDNSFAPVVVGGYNNKQARYDGAINDNFTCYAVKAKSEIIHLEEFEISQGKWFPISELTEILAWARQNGKDKNHDATVTYNNQRFSLFHLFWLQNFCEGKCFRVVAFGKRNVFIA